MSALTYPTPHINARPEDIAKTVLMPGDPRRSEYVAKNFFDSPKLFNSVRGVQGYTGKWKGHDVSVMASGMGMPSIGIYSYELFHAFEVENIIRIGSAGAMNEKVQVRDLIFGMGACTDSAYAKQFDLPGTFSAVCDYSLLEGAIELAKERGSRYHVGNILSSDRFYSDDPSDNIAWRKMGVLAVEMEAAALYMNAARAGKKALAICTISDSLITGEALSADEREKTFTEMMELSLDLAIKQA